LGLGTPKCYFSYHGNTKCYLSSHLRVFSNSYRFISVLFVKNMHLDAARRAAAAPRGSRATGRAEGQQ